MAWSLETQPILLAGSIGFVLVVMPVDVDLQAEHKISFMANDFILQWDSVGIVFKPTL